MNHDLRRLIAGIESRLTGSGGTLFFYGSSVHFGGLDKLLRITKDILSNGSTSLDAEGNPSCMPFAKEILPIRSEAQLDAWIRDKMAHSLFFEALCLIISAEDSLRRHYDPDALLRSPSSTEKLLLAAKCLDEQDLPTLVALDLRGGGFSSGRLKRDHSSSIYLPSDGDEEESTLFSPLRRQGEDAASPPLSTSCPGFTEVERGRFLKKKHWLDDESQEGGDLSSSPSPTNDCGKTTLEQSIITFNHSETLLLRASDTSDNEENRTEESPGRQKSNKQHSTPVRGTEIMERGDKMPSIVHLSPKKTHRRALSDTPVFRLSSTLDYHHSPSSHDTTDNLQEREHNWSTVTPPTEGWTMPLPLSNESLHSFLSSGSFSRHQARLDKENAHLILAELIIQASTKKYGDPCMGGSVLGPLSFRPPVSSNIQKGNVPKNSAESVALSLLEQFDERHEIKAYELNLIMGDQSGVQPEESLSLARSEEGIGGDNCIREECCVNDEEEEAPPTSELRGTHDWAPPRPQLILQLHSNKSRSLLLEGQKYRCAGCSMVVEKRYSKTYRYCHYFGKLFCTGCHSNASHVIPAHVIKKWDFKSYFVSDFASTVLCSMYSDPLFNLQDLNPELLLKESKLRKAVQVRSLCSKIYPFVLNCRLETTYMSEINNYPVIDPHVFSLKDLCRVKSKNYTTSLLSLLENLMQHIMKCSLCKARGFLCEGCRSQDILFPFEADVHQCYRCYACYHVPCFTQSCSKCLRIDLRKKSSASRRTT